MQTYTPEQEAWLHDLETTVANQGANRLRWADDSFCCLGRACEVLGLESYTDRDYYSYGGHSVTLPVIAWEKLLLRDSCGSFLKQFEYGGLIVTNLVNVNDVLRWTFKEIAAWIRANPWQVFTNFEKE